MMAHRAGLRRGQKEQLPRAPTKRGPLRILIYFLNEVDNVPDRIKCIINQSKIILCNLFKSRSHTPIIFNHLQSGTE